MDNITALKILVEVAANYNATGKDHAVIQEALRTIDAALHVHADADVKKE
jgi:hypothetical protein